ncbi:archaellin/type IV pilin N-terminal domain-containing protein [Nitrosopumilus zosterae]|uniref:archaellin/type IV pilin N-terminal domain-containing protein n=1 Tax=Nitrosopumilus zosterae TaxID=718286 RepID=UPI002203E96E|nr:archaellin/type IV pilin N-terminal domain-containing protein [Nitrosopumilus zosterae]BDQ30654.1 flagellin [Nitrosopumilus zosterae]
MKLQRKGTRHSHRGVIGVESAIVMIAFVIVAAALAFVVLNMGFTTSQKAKTTIISGLGESSSSMQVAGKVIGVGCTSSSNGCSTPYLNATAYPIKITSGGDAVDLSAATTAVKYVSNSIEYDDIYSGTVTDAEYRSLDLAFEGAVANSLTNFSGNMNPVSETIVTNTAAFIYWTVSGSTINSILDDGEHAVLAVAFEDGERPTSLDTVRVEIIPATGASLSVERQVPTITTSVVDLG